MDNLPGQPKEPNSLRNRQILPRRIYKNQACKQRKIKTMG